MPINIDKIKKNQNTIAKLNNSYFDKATKAYDDLVKKGTSSYEYMDVKKFFADNGLTSGLQTLGNEHIKFSRDYPIADGCITLPNTLMVGKVEKFRKDEYEDGKATGVILMSGYKLWLCDGKIAMSILNRHHDDLEGFQRELAISCSFDVTVPDDKAYKEALEDNLQGLKEDYLCEFVQLNDFYILPGWVTSKQEGSFGYVGTYEANANKVTALSHLK